MTVEKFRGEHFFLSNMYELEVPLLSEPGVWVSTSEHAYQAAKFVDLRDQAEVALAEDGIASKEIAHELEAEGAPTLDNWPSIKKVVMQNVLWDKFRFNTDIAEKLIDTGSQELVEGNTWQDRYWGVCPPGTNNGQNNLGKLLMSVRTTLREELKNNG